MFILSIMQILEGNARKVGAVRFEQINHDDATLKSKEVTRLVPKFMKRKGSSSEESDKTGYSEVRHQDRAEDDDVHYDGYISSEPENDHELHNDQ